MSGPSVRHRLVTRFIAATMRGSAADTDAEAAQRLLRSRPRRTPSTSRRSRRSCDVTTDTSRGYPVHTLTPRTDPPPHDRRTVVYLHGGAYVADIAPAHWRIAARLARELDAVVVLPRYPLAPEATWHTSRRSLLDLVRVDAHGRAPVLIGDSAGGGLALALAQARETGDAPLDALVLISPWVDLTVAQSPEALQAADDPWLDADGLRQSGRLWAGGDDPARAELSPLHGSLAALPPTLVVTGTRDVLHPQALELVERIRHAGGSAQLVTGDRLLHVYPLLPVPEVVPAIADIIGFVDRSTGGRRS